jgi:hypothetical protein
MATKEDFIVPDHVKKFARRLVQRNMYHSQFQSHGFTFFRLFVTDSDDLNWVGWVFVTVWKRNAIHTDVNEKTPVVFSREF